MPKKQKKPLNKKPLKKSKLKNVVNVKINIDNSKKTTGRRVAATSKAPTQQSFANFPSYQPTRIQQLEPKQQFNNADLTKTIDEIYQKQFKVYMDTQDKDFKKMIEENDDSLKKDLAPSQKDSAPGAFNVYADNKGKVVSEGRLQKETWINPNELKGNSMAGADAESFGINQLFEGSPVIVETVSEIEATPANIADAENLTRELRIKQIYEDYVSAYKQYYEDNNYAQYNPQIPNSSWSNKTSAIIKKINKFGTKESENVNKMINKRNKQN